MSNSLNRVCLIGRVGRDPEIRSMQGSGLMASLSLATSEKWRDKVTGEQRGHTEWHNITIFNEHIIEVVERYLSKGSRIYIEGSLHTRRYKDQSGTERSTTEIVLRRFQGVLIMLDGAARSDAPEPDSSSG